MSSSVSPVLSLWIVECWMPFFSGVMVRVCEPFASCFVVPNETVPLEV